MMERLIIKSFLFCVIVLSACYYDVEEVLYPASNCVTTNLSSQTHIQPIIQRNCYACHSAAVNSGNITLEGYNQLVQHINSGRVMGAIRHESGFLPMPQNAPKLIPCDIAKIEQWVADGAPNN